MPERSHDTRDWTEITEQTAPVWDPALGAGRRLPITPELTVDVFESADLTRVATPDIRVELFGPARPHLTGERIVYEHTGATGSLLLGLDRDGTLTLKRSAPPASTTEPDHAPLDVATPPPVAKPEPEQPLSHPSSPATPEPSAQQEAKEAAERVKLTGRLGQSPTFRTSPRGTLIGSFSLAVHKDDGSTVWHRIIAFGSRAEQLRTRVATGDLGKGREVDVVGYPHTRDVPGKNGNTRTVTEVHAAAVVKRS